VAGKNKIKLIVPMDRPIAVFTLHTDLNSEEVLSIFDHFGWDYFVQKYDFKVHKSHLIPDTENAYIQLVASKVDREESND